MTQSGVFTIFDIAQILTSSVHHTDEAEVACDLQSLASDPTGIPQGGGAPITTSPTLTIDVTPPIISGMPTEPCTLWPSNQKMVTVATVTASDALSGLAPGSFTVTGTSSEPASDPKSPDIVITPNGSGGYVIQLRADRLGGGKGRVCMLNATANDLAGNTATITASCTVPHDQGK